MVVRAASDLRAACVVCSLQQPQPSPPAMLWYATLPCHAAQCVDLCACACGSQGVVVAKGIRDASEGVSLPSAAGVADLRSCVGTGSGGSLWLKLRDVRGVACVLPLSWPTRACHLRTCVPRVISCMLRTPCRFTCASAHEWFQRYALWSMCVAPRCGVPLTRVRLCRPR